MIVSALIMFGVSPLYYLLLVAIDRQRARIVPKPKTVRFTTEQEGFINTTLTIERKYALVNWIDRINEMVEKENKKHSETYFEKLAKMRRDVHYGCSLSHTSIHFADLQFQLNPPVRIEVGMKICGCRLVAIKDDLAHFEYP